MKQFLDKYDTVIFDMDGVITSEENYWNCAALTVREHLTGERPCADAAEVRKEVFLNDTLIALLKGKGVNSNWDLGYVTVLISIIKGSDDPDTIYDFAKTLSDNILDSYEPLAYAASLKLGCDVGYTARNGALWNELQQSFQEWFLGSGTDKKGLIYSEKPLIPQDVLTRMLSELSKAKRLCIGTGRPADEIFTPLDRWGVTDFFASDGRCNYDHVKVAEERTAMTLTKPHPYMFLKALYGTDYDDEKIINGDYDRSKISRTLIVGDAGADILAAKAMGADFCAVLTGVNGEKARGYFREHGAEYIINSAADLI